MSLMGTLAKVAIGVAVVKGIGAMSKGGAGTQSEGGLFGGPNSPQREAGSASGGGLEDIMGNVFGKGGQQGGGLGGLLESLQGAASGNGSLEDVMRNARQGGGNSQGNSNASNSSSKPTSKTGKFGDVLSDAFSRRGEPQTAPTEDQEAIAGLMLKAMIQAAKADGVVDQGERDKLLGKLGDVSAEERAFVTREMEAPVDAAGLARQVPRGLEHQVYAVSVMGIKLDDNTEARYLHELASAMNIDRDTVNRIHDKLGVAKIYQ